MRLLILMAEQFAIHVFKSPSTYIHYVSAASKKQSSEWHTTSVMLRNLFGGAALDVLVYGKCKFREKAVALQKERLSGVIRKRVDLETDKQDHLLLCDILLTTM